jgi:hypothetical protein
MGIRKVLSSGRLFLFLLCFFAAGVSLVPVPTTSRLVSWPLMSRQTLSISL